MWYRVRSIKEVATTFHRTNQDYRTHKENHLRTKAHWEVLSLPAKESCRSLWASSSHTLQLWIWFKLLVLLICYVNQKSKIMALKCLWYTLIYSHQKKWHLKASQWYCFILLNFSSMQFKFKLIWYTEHYNGHSLTQSHIYIYIISTNHL